MTAEETAMPIVAVRVAREGKTPEREFLIRRRAEGPGLPALRVVAFGGLDPGRNLGWRLSSCGERGITSWETG